MRCHCEPTIILERAQARSRYLSSPTLYNNENGSATSFSSKKLNYNIIIRIILNCMRLFFIARRIASAPVVPQRSCITIVGETVTISTRAIDRGTRSLS